MSQTIEEHEQTEDDKLVDIINQLSPDAYYICGLEYFGAILGSGNGYGKPVLNAINKNATMAIQDRQHAAFQELLGVGFCHGDVERSVYGYRSTWQGQRACALIRGFEAHRKELGR